jgi:predicted ATPase
MDTKKDTVRIYKLDNKYDYTFDKIPDKAIIKLEYDGCELKLLDAKFRDIFNAIKENKNKSESELEILGRISALLRNYNKVSSSEFDNV